MKSVCIKYSIAFDSYYISIFGHNHLDNFTCLLNIHVIEKTHSHKEWIVKVQIYEGAKSEKKPDWIF